MNDVRDAFLVWSIAELLGVLGLPAAGFLFARLPGAGLGLARPLAMLVLAYPVWLLASLGLVPYGGYSALLGLGVLAVLSASVLRATRRSLTDRLSFRLWLAGELVFTVAFFGWAALRAFVPDVLETEKPMDMAFVNAVNRSEWFPPHDPWLAGADLNYYYYGHYVVALLVRVTGVDPAVGYNLAVALFYALVAGALFAVAAALGLAVRRAAPRLRSALLPGLAAVLFGVVLGNLAGTVQLLEQPESLGTYDWFAPSRVIEGTANEFPFFSFLLGDLHAHVMATPFALVALALALQIALAGPRLPSARRWLPATVELLLAALVLGSLYAVNTLDFPTALLLVLGALVLWVAGPGRPARPLAAALWGVALALGSLAIFAPFVAGFSPDTHGVALVSEHEPFTELVWELALIYALPVWVLARAFSGRFRPTRYLAWSAVAVLVALVLIAPERLAGLAVLLVAVAVAIHAALDTSLDQARRFFWLVAAIGLGLVAVGDFAYVRDAFDGTASYRFNTVFKAGYQAWFLLAVAAACAAFGNDSRLRRSVLVAWRAGLTVLVLALAVYPLLGSYSRTDGFSGERTLDGMRWLELRAPGDAAAIRWLRDEVDGAPTVVEAVGADFSPAGYARVSTFTGLPTVVGWVGHELQWGHDPGRRAADVDAIYGTRDVGRARRLLERYDARYVFVGSLERAAYPPAALAKFGRLGRPVFSAGGTTVYAVGGA